MAFRIGKSDFDIQRIKGSRNINYRGVYVGSEHVWPDYKFDKVDNTLIHKGAENALGNYDLENVSFSLDKENPISFDPAGGLLTFKIWSNESSNWHHMSFKILVGTELELISVKEGDVDLLNYIETPSKMNYVGAVDEYIASIYTVNLDERNTQANEVKNFYEDTPITLTFKIESNDDLGEYVHEILLMDFQNEFKRWKNVEDPILVTYYGQKSNYCYSTLVSWVKNITNSNISGYNQEYSISSNETEGYVYLAIAFGISNDGGITYNWGPANDHLNSENKININEGNVLENISQYFYDIKTTPNNDWLKEIKIEDPTIDSNYYIVPIKIIIKNENTAANNINRKVEYKWIEERNTNWDPSRLAVENTSDINLPVESNRTLTGILRGEGSPDRTITLGLSFNYDDKHKFTI